MFTFNSTYIVNDQIDKTQVFKKKPRISDGGSGRTLSGDWWKIHGQPFHYIYPRAALSPFVRPIETGGEIRFVIWKCIFHFGSIRSEIWTNAFYIQCNIHHRGVGLDEYASLQKERNISPFYWRQIFLQHCPPWTHELINKARAYNQTSRGFMKSCW